MADDPDIIKTELTLSFGATLAVTTNANGFQDWIRPAAEFSTTWSGVPNEEQLKLATKFIQSQVLSPILEEIIVTAQERLTEARRGA